MNAETRPRPNDAGAPASTAGVKTKVNEPHKAFEHPAEVVADPSLSKEQKVSALDSLEQDARQLATAADEGMTGGEDTNLREVLVAKEALELPGSEAAFAVVMQTLEAKLAKSQGTDDNIVFSRAIDAMNAARKVLGHPTSAPRTPQGAAKPGSKQELEEELAKEKLDP